MLHIGLLHCSNTAVTDCPIMYSAFEANQAAQGTSDINDSVKTQPNTVTFRNANRRFIM